MWVNFFPFRGSCYRQSTGSTAYVIQRERRLDGGQDLWEGEYTYRCILTNDYTSTNREIVEFYNLRGGKERIFDDMNNVFGWTAVGLVKCPHTPIFWQRSVQNQKD